jgi:hypothetical protein
MIKSEGNLMAGMQLYVPFALLAVGLGWVASSGSIPAAAVLAGLVAGVIMLLNPVFLLWAVLFGGLVASGVAMLYAPQLQLIRWGVAFASAALIGIALMGRLSGGRLAAKNPVSPIAWMLLALFVVATLAGFASRQSLPQLVVGLKSYFQVAGIFVALTMIVWPRKVIDALPPLMLGVAILQLPFVLQQYVVLVPRRMGYGEGIVPYDIVAGTFGASEFGGGANAVLSAFMLIVVAVLLALWNNKALSTAKLAVLALPLMVPIFVNESKVSLLYLMVIVGVIFKNEILVRPGRAILSGTFIAGILAGLLVAYSAFYADDAQSVGDLVAGTVEQNFSSDVGHGEFYLNRWSALAYWSAEHSIRRPADFLIGHGTRASREGGGGLDAGNTLASRRYPAMGIGITGASALLWETGFFGLSLVLGMFMVAFRTAGILRERYRHDAYRSGLFSGLQAGVAILTLSLFHKSFFVFDIGYQTIIMLLFGFLVCYLNLSEEVTPTRSGISAA